MSSERIHSAEVYSALSPVLGLPLDAALRIAREMGQENIQVLQTCDPRAPRAEGTLRVLRVRGNEWTVARFLDGVPREEATE